MEIRKTLIISKSYLLKSFLYIISLLLRCLSSSEDDVVDGDEHELNDITDEANNQETHGAGLQDLHVLYRKGIKYKLGILVINAYHFYLVWHIC